MKTTKELKKAPVLTVADLLEERIDGTTSSGDAMLHGNVIALDAMDGHKLFDTRKNKRSLVEKFFDRRILAIWSDTKLDKIGGFQSSACHAVTMLYVEHEEEK